MTDLDAVLSDYEASREDVRSLENVRGNMFGFALSALTIIAAIGSRDCRFLRLAAGLDRQCTPTLPDAVLVFLPAVPVALVLYLMLIMNQIVLQSFYLRSLERTIRRQKLSSDRLPLWTEIQVASSRLSRGPTVTGVLQVALTLITTLIFGSAITAVFLVVDTKWERVMTATYVPLIAMILYQAFRLSRSARKVYRALRARALGEVRRHHRPGPRPGWAFYALVPRRSADFIFKIVFIAIGAVIGGVAAAQAPVEDRASIGIAAALLSVGLFELVIYQGRYLWNDLRGYEQDRTDPEAANRKRLAWYFPDYGSAVRMVAGNLLARSALVIAVALVALPAACAVVLGVAAGVLVLTAVAYELVRDLRPSGDKKLTQTGIALHLLVGCGYAIRAVLGFVIVLLVVRRDLGAQAAAALSAGVFAAGFAIMFVGLTWLLDGTKYVSGSPDPPLVPMVGRGICSKPQMYVQLRSTGLDLLHLGDDPERIEESAYTSAIIAGGDRSKLRFWLTLSAASTAVLPALVIDGVNGGSMVASVGLMLAASYVTARFRRGVRLPVVLAVTFLTVAAAWWRLAAEGRSPWSILGGLVLFPGLWVITTAVDNAFRNSSLWSLKFELSERARSFWEKRWPQIRNAGLAVLLGRHSFREPN